MQSLCRVFYCLSNNSNNSAMSKFAMRQSINNSYRQTLFSNYLKRQAMNKFVLNIGLNVGYIEPRIWEDATMYNLKQAFGNDFIYFIADGQGDWGNERTVVVSGQTNLEIADLKRLLIKLASNLKQDAIAYTFNGHGDLAYREGYRGEFYEFNNEFFIQ